MVDSLYQGAVTSGNSTHSAIMSSSEYLSQVCALYTRSHTSSGSVMPPQRRVRAVCCRIAAPTSHAAQSVICMGKLFAIAQLHDILELVCRLAAT